MNEYRKECVEFLQYDTMNGAMIAKFKDEFHLLKYDVETERWINPCPDMDSPYDRAYYLGQGCWERMEAFPQKWAEEILENKWFGRISLDDNDPPITIILKNGKKIFIGDFRKR